MKLHYKISLYTVLSVALISLIVMFAGGKGINGVFFISFGALCLVIGAAYLLAGIIMMIAKKPVMGQAMLIASGILLLIGFGVCTPIFFMVAKGI